MNVTETYFIFGLEQILVSIRDSETEQMESHISTPTQSGSVFTPQTRRGLFRRSQTKQVGCESSLKVQSGLTRTGSHKVELQPRRVLWTVSLSVVFEAFRCVLITSTVSADLCL